MDCYPPSFERDPNYLLPCEPGVGAIIHHLFSLPCERRKVGACPGPRIEYGAGFDPGVGAKNPMNTTPETRLLELYDRVAEAPDAIERLRKFVLDLAVRGKLVEQDPEDEPAEELLEQIAAEKARLVKSEQSEPRNAVEINSREDFHSRPSALDGRD